MINNDFFGGFLAGGATIMLMAGLINHFMLKEEHEHTMRWMRMALENKDITGSKENKGGKEDGKDTSGAGIGFRGPFEGL